MFKDFFDGLQGAIAAHSSPGIRPGLERVALLLERLGNPQNSFKAIHVVGTNGKGSVSSFLSNILMYSGYRTATYTSPHLFHMGERLTINGTMLSPEIWQEAAARIFGTIEADPVLCNDSPSFFETLTAISFLLMKEQDIDIAVVEAGMGGRLDATNTMDKVILSIITNIGLDHSDYLGKDIRSIAEEKFAVIRNGGKALFYGGPEILVKRFKDICRGKNCTGKVLTEELSFANIKTGVNGTEYSLYMKGNGLTLPVTAEIPGLHQVSNSALAILAAEELRKSFNRISIDNIRTGILHTKWAGRMEFISRRPLVMLDGAHNVQGTEVLVNSLKEMFDAKERNGMIFVYTSMSDKNYTKSLSLLSKCGAGIILTEIPGNQRCESSDKLFEAASAFRWRNDPVVVVDPFAAVRKGCSEAEIVIICGSLYLIGFVRDNLIKEFSQI